jgi:hypothetical protein
VTHPGYCKACGRRWDSCDVCDRCIEEADAEEAEAEEDGLTGDCSIDCLERCAYPGQFSECEL